MSTTPDPSPILEDLPAPRPGDRFLRRSHLSKVIWRCWEVDPTCEQGARPVSLPLVLVDALDVLRESGATS